MAKIYLDYIRSLTFSVVSLTTTAIAGLSRSWKKLGSFTCPSWSQPTVWRWTEAREEFYFPSASEATTWNWVTRYISQSAPCSACPPFFFFFSPSITTPPSPGTGSACAGGQEVHVFTWPRNFPITPRDLLSTGLCLQTNSTTEKCSLVHIII